MVMAEAQESKPNQSSIFQASASITSAKTPLAQESHVDNFQVKLCIDSAQKEAKASGHVDKANIRRAGRKLFSCRRQERMNLTQERAREGR